MVRFIKFAVVSLALFGLTLPAQGADLLNPTPVAQQDNAYEQSMFSVDSINYEFSVLGGAFERNDIGTASNAMFTASLASPIPFFERFGFQTDLGIGVYDGDFTSAAAALHLFYRDPETGSVGIYGDWSYVNPEHAGRVAGEFAFYNGRWSLDVLAGMQFGQHVLTEFIDEVDLSFYFTDNFRGSVGHRLTSRGHVGNVSFESLLNDQGFEGWSLFGEIEAGEDNYVGGFGGIRYAFGSPTTTLIERDRKSSLKVRIPRNISSVSQCARLVNPIPATGLRGEVSTLCASESEINSRPNFGISKD
ncbi:MAG: hypothetical protein AAF217_06145 [Pseudomonadota bacterium]